MKILFFTHYFPPEVNAPASRTYEHCMRWVKAGHDVTVITCAPNCPDGIVFSGYANRLLRQIETIDGIRVVRVWTYLAPNAGTTKRIASYLSYMTMSVLASIRLPRPDVIVATSPQFFCGWAGVLASWLKWRPLVLEIRDIWPESIEAVGAIKNRPALKTLEFLERRMYRASDHIVAVGEGYRAKILEKVDMADRISVVTNGVDMKLFQPLPPDEALLKKWNLAGKFVCSYVGTIGMAHGLDVVVEAAKLLRAKGREDVRFLLVGDGASRKALEARAAAEGVSDMVIFTGRLPKEEMPAVLASSSVCLIHLKKCELFATVMPSKIFETMAMGRPIIMGVRGEACDIVLRAGAGVEMEPDSADSLLTAIEQLTAEPEAASQRGLAAREFVAKHYNRDALAETMLKQLHATAMVPYASSSAEGL